MEAPALPGANIDVGGYGLNPFFEPRDINHVL